MLSETVLRKLVEYGMDATIGGVIYDAVIAIGVHDMIMLATIGAGVISGLAVLARYAYLRTHRAATLLVHPHGENYPVVNYHRNMARKGR